MIEKRRNRRGNVAVVGLSLTVVLAFGALAVDVGIQRVANAQVQAAIEAGVLGGAGYLDGTEMGVTLAVQNAVTLANANPVIGGWGVTASDVQLGIYDRDADTFTASTDSELVNALRIQTTHTSIRTVLANAAFGEGSMTSTNEAMALRPPGGPTGETNCYLPLAIPDCEYLDWMGGGMTSNPPPMKFMFNDANNDNIGWGNPFTSPSTTNIIEAFQTDTCYDQTLKVDDPMNIGNGQNTSAQDYIKDILNEENEDGVYPEPWDPDIAPLPDRTDPSETYANLEENSYVEDGDWGNTIQGPVALVDAGDCASMDFTGTMPVTGFAWAVIYDGKDTGSPKNLYVQLDFLNDHQSGGTSDPDAIGNVLGYEPPILINP